MPGHSFFWEKTEGLARTNLKTSLVLLLTGSLALGYVGGFAEPIRAYIAMARDL